MRRIGGRIHRARSDVAEAARHADAIRPHQVLAVVVARVGVVALRVPGLGGLLVECGVREQAQADDAARIAVERADRLRRAVAERLAARADRDARILALVLERIGGAALGADVEPEAAPVRVGRGGALEARLVDEPEVVPARFAVVAERGMRAHDLEQVEGAEGGSAQAIPEAVVAAAPDDPHVASGDLGRVELDGAVHVVEVVVGGMLERRAVAARLLGLVEHRAGLRPPGAAREEQDTEQPPRRRAPTLQKHGATPLCSCGGKNARAQGSVQGVQRRATACRRRRPIAATSWLSRCACSHMRLDVRRRLANRHRQDGEVRLRRSTNCLAPPRARGQGAVVAPRRSDPRGNRAGPVA